MSTNEIRRKMKDKSCIIVGGAGGIGTQICHQLLQNHVKNLAIVDIQSAPNEQLDQLLHDYPLTKIYYFQIDVTDANVLRTTFNRINEIFQSFDILINAAGIFNDKNIDLTFKVNVCGLMHATMIGVELMQQKKRIVRMDDGIVINIASVVGLDPWHLLPIYTASKHAVVGFSRAFSHEYYYNKTGVKIIVLCPGPTRTTFVKQFAGNMIYPDESLAREFFKSVPMQSAEDVGKHVIDLCKTAENGSVWISDNGVLESVSMKTYQLPLNS